MFNRQQCLSKTFICYPIDYICELNYDLQLIKQQCNSMNGKIDFANREKVEHVLSPTSKKALEFGYKWQS